MEDVKRNIKVGSICKQSRPISSEQARLRYVIKEVSEETVNCYDTKEPDYTYRNVAKRDLVLVKET